MTGLILRLCCWFIDCKILCVEFPGLMHVMGGEVERGFDEPVAESLIGVHVPSAGQPLPRGVWHLVFAGTTCHSLADMTSR